MNRIRFSIHPRRAAHALGVVVRTARGVARGIALALAMALAAPVGVATAQCASPTVAIFVDRSIEVLRVGDFDPGDTRFHSQIFTVTLCSDLPREVRLKLIVTSTTMGAVAEGTSDPFEIGAGTISLTNRDLTRAGSPYELHDFTMNAEAEELDHSTLETGRLPEGRYCFEIHLVDGDSGAPVAPPARDCLDAMNPLDIEILRPGAAFGEDPGFAIAEQPVFQWTSRARCWRFSISQAEPDDASGEDVMEHIPVFTTLLALSPGDCAGGSAEIVQGGAGLLSWHYPLAAQDIQPDRTYCWQLTALVETPRGTEDFESEIFCFRQWTPGTVRTASLLEELIRRILMARGETAEGLSPTGEIRVNGRGVDPAALQEIVEGIEEGRIEIEELWIE